MTSDKCAIEYKGKCLMTEKKLYKIIDKRIAGANEARILQIVVDALVELTDNYNDCPIPALDALLTEEDIADLSKWIKNEDL
jgi:hypothetical protein